MNISKVDSNIKTNCKIAAGSLITGGCISALSMVVGNVEPKDVFQYKNLSAAKKNVVKYSGLGGLAIAAILALYSKINMDKSSK